MQHHRHARMTPRAQSLLWTPLAKYWLAGLLLVVPAAVIAQDVPVDNIVAENWTGVARELHSVTPKTESAVLRMIKGHACLATNRNNESLELFASASNDDDRQTWQTWANRFAEDHDCAVAWYFLGDAAARQKDWDSAATDLDKAIAADPKCYLALNARGVVKHAQGSTIKAQEFFEKATKAKADFADAYASMGTCYVFRNTKRGSMKKAQDSLDAATAFGNAETHTEDEKLAIALMGRGCALSALQFFEHAKTCFLDESLPDHLLPLAKRNLLANEFDVLKRTVKRAEDAGMTLRATELRPNTGRVLYQGHFSGEGIHKMPDCSKWWCLENCTKVGPVKKTGDEAATLSLDLDEALLPVLSRDPDATSSAVIPDYDQLTSFIDESVTELSLQLAPAPAPITEVDLQRDPLAGGLTTKQIQLIRTSKGACGVCNVYGLLYTVRMRSFGSR